MDGEGNVITQPNGRDVASFADMATKVNEYLTLKAIAEPTKANQVDLLLAEMAFGKVKLADAKTRLGELDADMSDEQKAKAKAALAQLQQGEVDAEIIRIVKEKNPRTKPAQAEVGKIYWDMYQEGKRPGSFQTSQAFWALIMEHGDAAGDAEKFSVGLENVKKLLMSQPRLAGNPQVAKFLEQKEARLAELQGGSGGDDPMGGGK